MSLYMTSKEHFMKEVGKFSLKNGGGFVTKLQFYYIDENGHMNHRNGTGNIILGQRKSADPGDFGVPDGTLVGAYAFVVWGSDNYAKQMFTYKKGIKKTANYVITGTTLNNNLGFEDRTG